MPPVIFAPAALRDLQRLREFLLPKSKLVAQRAATRGNLRILKKSYAKLRKV